MIARLLDGWLPPQPTARSLRGTIRELVTDRMESSDIHDDLHNCEPTRSSGDVIRDAWPLLVGTDDDD